MSGIDIGPIPEGWRRVHGDEREATYVKSTAKVVCQSSSEYYYWVMVRVQMTSGMDIDVYGFINAGQTPRQRIEEMAKILLPHSALVGEWLTSEVSCT